ncbi:MAG: galactose mutarotase [Rhodobacteraceae bacterium]|nr:galactose mutarotase [Paracoccaceae bacterium]
MNIRTFGTMKSGQTVKAIDLEAGDLRVTLLTLGAFLQDVRLRGHDYSLTLGSQNLADYESDMVYHGALVGPVVNRFSGATARLGDDILKFEANQLGRHCLHSASGGTHFKIWDIVEHGADFVVLAVDLPDGEAGFPGNRRVEARFELSAPANLKMSVTVQTDALTLINFANHSYWNLDGTANWDGHQIRIAADHVLPTTADDCPTGEIADVTGTGHDLREMRVISRDNPLFDHNFCLSDSRMALRDVLWLRGKSGVTMTVATTEPGIQVYDGRNGIRPGHAAYEGLAIEAQLWPDAPNHAGFPSIELAAGEELEQVTEWRFEME